MLNISDKNIGEKIDVSRFGAFKTVLNNRFNRALAFWINGFFGVAFIMMFVPWTQSIRSNGKLTTLYPDERPQTIQSTIDGRIEQWYVREGDYVEKGDTIVHISEIKDAYFDPELIERTKDQISAKTSSVAAYARKVVAMQDQVKALRENKRLKLNQTTNKIAQSKLKVTADSIDFQAAMVNFEIAEKQLGRQEKLYEQGLKSLTDLEKRKNNFQKEQAKLISAESKLLSSRNQLINARIEYNAIQSEFDNKIAKAGSDLSSAESSKFNADAELTKLRNQLTNYELRQNFRHIKAPQSGFVTKALQAGIGETVKAGERIVSIVRLDVDLAVELYVTPVDLPLIRRGQKLRLLFDGWPAIVFSGWPGLSFGTFGAEVVAIDNMISENNKYRILVAPDKQDEPWPELLRIGSGAVGFALLKDVPIWYELWRNLNSFPPDFYIEVEENRIPNKNKPEIKKK